jgi:(1->4)-alpha-D-glucan 1-alpha-D-glucosylmutase
VNQNPDYVEALTEFIGHILEPGPASRPNLFLQELEQLIRPVIFFGAINSLAQTLLKLTVPGIPDLYQGTEFWDYSLVDPDNRRPVDYAARERGINDLQRLQDEKSPCEVAKELLQEFVADNGNAAIKLFVTSGALAFRQQNPALFRNGSYVPLFATGAAAQHLCAFARELNIGSKHATCVVAVPRLSYTLMQGRIAAPVRDIWGETELTLPPRSSNEFENVFTGETLRAGSNRSLLCRELFAHFPVALLTTR